MKHHNEKGKMIHMKIQTFGCIAAVMMDLGPDRSLSVDEVAL